MVKIDEDKLEIRLLREDDLGAIVAIDAKVTGDERDEYYQRKIAQMLDMRSSIGTSLVADYEGDVIGFIMGNIYMGEFGIPQTTASLDTIGIDPDYRRLGIGALLFDEWVRNVKVAGVEHIQTLVDWNNIPLLKFFNRSGFAPSDTLNLEMTI